MLQSAQKAQTILVSGASGVVGYGILRSLRKYNPSIILIGTTIYDRSIVPAFCNCFEKAPKTVDASYMDWLCRVIRRHRIDMIIPGIEADVIRWNQERGRIFETGAFPLLNNAELIDLCADKWQFYKKLKSTGSNFVIDSRLEGTFDELKGDFGLPFLLKPRCGYASRGIKTVESQADFLANRHKLGSTLMAQPIIGDEDHEYTVSAFFDSDSRLLCHMGLERRLSREGFTEYAQVVDVNGVRAALVALSKIFKPIGPTNFQFRLHRDELKLLEINPRISSSTSIRTAFGYNESAISVEYFLHHACPEVPTICRGKAVRYVEDHIFYDSDHL